MKKYTLDNIQELLWEVQEGNRKLRKFADELAVNIDRALLRLEILMKEVQK